MCECSATAGGATHQASPRRYRRPRRVAGPAFDPEGVRRGCGLTRSAPRSQRVRLSVRSGRAGTVTWCGTRLQHGVRSRPHRPRGPDDRPRRPALLLRCASSKSRSSATCVDVPPSTAVGTAEGRPSLIQRKVSTITARIEIPSSAISTRSPRRPESGECGLSPLRSTAMLPVLISACSEYSYRIFHHTITHATTLLRHFPKTLMIPGILLYLPQR